MRTWRLTPRAYRIVAKSALICVRLFSHQYFMTGIRTVRCSRAPELPKIGKKIDDPMKIENDNS